MIKSEFIDSLWTDERRADAYRLWDWLEGDLTRLDEHLPARTLQATTGDGSKWEELNERWGTELGFESEPDRWGGIIAMVIGGVMTKHGLIPTMYAERTVIIDSSAPPA